MKATFAVRMAWRETRGGARHFAVLFGCVALGVAALVSVGTFGANLDRTLTREARARPSASGAPTISRGTATFSAAVKVGIR